MTMQLKVAGAIAILALSICSANAAADKYNITAAEHQACDVDATSLCYGSTDEDQVISCMRANRTSLSIGCLTTFEAGLRKRHLPL